jgi:hypothetical protein
MREGIVPQLSIEAFVFLLSCSISVSTQLPHRYDWEHVVFAVYLQASFSSNWGNGWETYYLGHSKLYAAQYLPT